MFEIIGFCTRLINFCMQFPVCKGINKYDHLTTRGAQSSVLHDLGPNISLSDPPLLYIVTHTATNLTFLSPFSLHKLCNKKPLSTAVIHVLGEPTPTRKSAKYELSYCGNIQQINTRTNTDPTIQRKSCLPINMRSHFILDYDLFNEPAWAVTLEHQGK